jgi:sulfide dehydrogenase cytochrome subunit
MLRARNHLVTAAASVALLALSGAAASAEVTRAELMANTCLACHSGGANAADSTITSLIAGYPGSMIASNMKAFRDGTRPATVMQRHAKGYSDEEIQALADYFDSMR